MSLLIPKYSQSSPFNDQLQRAIQLGSNIGNQALGFSQQANQAKELRDKRQSDAFYRARIFDFERRKNAFDEQMRAASNQRQDDLNFRQERELPSIINRRNALTRQSDFDLSMDQRFRPAQEAIRTNDALGQYQENQFERALDRQYGETERSLGITRDILDADLTGARTDNYDFAREEQRLALEDASQREANVNAALDDLGKIANDDKQGLEDWHKVHWRTFSDPVASQHLRNAFDDRGLPPPGVDTSRMIQDSATYGRGGRTQTTYRQKGSATSTSSRAKQRTGLDLIKEIEALEERILVARDDRDDLKQNKKSTKAADAELKSMHSRIEKLWKAYDSGGTSSEDEAVSRSIPGILRTN